MITMTSISIDTVPQKEDNFVETEIDGERIVMHVENGEFFVFNVTSDAIWSAIDGRASLGDICKTLAENFETEASQCRQDVLDFVQDLAHKNLVKCA